MNIIFSREVANELREKYLVLELETIMIPGKKIECFCVVPGDKISVTEMPVLNQLAELHQQFVNHLKAYEYSQCLNLIPKLQGKFGGELDTFYQLIQKRIEKS